MNTEQLKTASDRLEDLVEKMQGVLSDIYWKTTVLEFASQQSKIAVSEFKEKLKGEIERVRDLSVGDPAITSAYDNCIKLIGLTDKL